MELRRAIKEYFSFTRGERLGIIVLIVLISIVVAVKQMLFCFEQPTPADRESFEQFVAGQKAAEQHNQRHKVTLFTFDPNTIDSLSLAKLDLPFFVKRNLLRYRQHGGRFSRPRDFRKLYGMNDSVYAAIEPYLQITSPQVKVSIAASELKTSPKRRAQEKPNEEIAEEPAPRVERPLIDINKSSADELQQLRGIGPVLSARIVKFRDLLGGYACVDQLKEVYGLDPEVVDRNRDFLAVDSTLVRKLDFNFLSVDELAAHPYINYKEARRIVDFRSKNGYISDKNILLSDSVIGQEHFRKLSYYLK
ncbi:helix-hairpin-helix domain-containing protein [Mangrovibacterium marinum]|uniref:Competence ComEA-like helix-hairpin-helix protein n=1 Tax=Mangrovibacterium marinum TaxID=1639118 RepID=A0A2T5BZB7_9BACT|nr:helix-hairpin-helix domain-containing protein [Mangrovibacterium marinum]PTN07616.1 competence ComEA-like helix-hairpin-helix protein [Mangrovibacterium marinum]